MELPRETLSAVWRHWAGRSALLGLLMLTPLILALGIRWKLDLYQIREFSIETSRARCIAIARDFLAQRGMAAVAGGWKLQFEENRPFLDYVHRSLGVGKFVPPIQSFPASPASIRVQTEDAGEETAEVTISPHGKVTGYRFPSLLDEYGERLGDRQAAVASARAQMDRTISPADYQISEARVYEQTDAQGRRFYRVEWTAVHLELPELSFKLRFGVAGDAVFSQSIQADVAEAFLEREGLVATLYRTLAGFAPFYVVALIVYMLIRYIQRSIDKEISHKRAAVVALYLLAIVGLIYLTGDQGIVFGLSVGERAPQAASAFVILFLVAAALLAGVSYSSCEGDVRELFKGSMTSFDALLTGRVFSRTVARTFVIGFVAAAWLFFLQVVTNLAFEGGLEEPASLLFVYRIAHAQSPAGMVFLLLPLSVGFMLLFGLLIPLSIVGRMRRLRDAAWAFLLAIMLVNLFLLHGGFVTLPGAALTLGAEVFFMLALVRYFDVMTAFMCRVLAGYLVALTDVQMLTTIPESTVNFIHAVALTTLVASLVLLRYGREYTDEEVRPSYARALAERQSLSAQLSVAAVAQAQLTRTALPQVEGFSLAAVCRPARTVSGDYYDCFPLGPRSLGVLMINGAGRGLLDAMVIAYTKGFLLERVNSARSARELLADLLENLSTLLQEGDAFPELCFVILDGEQNTAAYSRTENFPGLISIKPAEEGGVSVREGSTAEMGSMRRMGERRLLLRHGLIRLPEGASILLFSSGFERSLVRAGIGDFREWLRKEWKHLVKSDAGATLLELAHAAMGGRAGWQTQIGEQDRTLMVVHTVSTESGSMERAA